MSLLNIDQNPKTKKGQKKGYLTGILYLKPTKSLCQSSTKECRSTCLNLAGRGAMKSVQDSRKRKTNYFLDDQDKFMAELVLDIRKLVKKAKKLKMLPAIRLNGTSDVDWENIRFKDGKNIFELFPIEQFYDYTKRVDRDYSIRNYNLTFSYSGNNRKECLGMLSNGISVAILGSRYTAIQFRGGLPKSIGIQDGDVDDLRFLDSPRSIIYLKPKGKAKTITNSFTRV